MGVVIVRCGVASKKFSSMSNRIIILFILANIQKGADMTSEQFEAYLKDIGGLVNGWVRPPDGDSSLMTPPPMIFSRAFFSIEDGWLQLVHDLIEELIAAGWDKELLQAKEKFGLRFYIADGSSELHQIITKYEVMSRTICEGCGEPGEPGVTKTGWHLTLCKKHWSERYSD